MARFARLTKADTDRIDRVLRERYATTTNEELAEVLGISATTVWRRAQVLGLDKDPGYLAAMRATRCGDAVDDLDEVIRERYPDEPTHVVAKAIGKTTSYVRRRAKAMGVLKSENRRHEWLKDEPPKGTSCAYRPPAVLLRAIRGLLRVRYGYVDDPTDPDALLHVPGTRTAPNEAYLTRHYGIKFKR